MGLSGLPEMKAPLSTPSFLQAADSPDRISTAPAAPQTDGRLLMSPTAPLSQGGCTVVPQQKREVLKIYFQAL